MGEDERLPPLTRRVPNENRGHKPAGQVGMPQLPDEVVARMLAAVRADAAADAALQDAAAESAGPAAARTAAQQAAPPKATPPDAAAEPAGQMTHHRPAPSMRTRKRTAHAARQAAEQQRAQARQRAEDDRQAEEHRQAEDDADTDQFPVVLAAGQAAEAVGSNDLAGPGAARPSPAPGRPVRPPASARAAVSAPEYLGRPLAGTTRAGRRHRILAAAAAAVAIVIGGSVALTLKAGPPASGAAAPALQRAAVTRDRAAAWIATQVGRGTIVSCDPVMCGALESHRFPARSLRKLTAGGSPMSATLVVATAVVRQQLGAQLSASAAPAVLARFGSGGSRIEVRAVAQHGAAAYWSAVSADVQARKESGALLLTSSRIGVAALAGTRLEAGQIDSRVLVTLSDLAYKRPIQIAAFGAGDPGAGLRVSPLRSAEVEQVPGAPNLPNAQFIRMMRSVLRGQPVPYAVASTRQVHLPGGRIALWIEFSAPAPLDLLNGPAATGG